MTGVLLVNMGSASDPREMKMFLSKMFKDPFIIPYGKTVRNILSFIISNTRYRKSWKKYELIGGSPIIDDTCDTVSELQAKLGPDFSVRLAFSYSGPPINAIMQSFIKDGINRITIIPLYPQASCSTTASVFKDVVDSLLSNKEVKINFVKEFYNHPGFVSFWSELIQKHIEENYYSNPYLVFSAHSIPKSLIEKGDNYANAVESCAKSIAEQCGLDYEVTYQSQMSKTTWIGPDTKQSLLKMPEKGKTEIVVIPISFVSENLETLYDLDNDVIPFGKNISGINKISRVKIPVANPQFLNLLCDLVKTYNNK